MNAALVISAADNVATALEPLEPGSAIAVGATTVTVVDDVPRGHKIAIRAIAAGAPVVKYGSPIGTATADIAAGAHVHTHNVASARGRRDLRAQQQADSRIHGAGAPGMRLAEPLDAD